MATLAEGCAAGSGGRLSSLHITLPFSVVQVWNDLEVGQVVKLPATDEQDGDMSLHAQRDGSNNISLRFIHKSLAAVADAYAADINIRKVSLSKLDSSSVPVKFACKPLLPPSCNTSSRVVQEQDCPASPTTEDVIPRQQSPNSSQPKHDDPNRSLIGQPRVALGTSPQGEQVKEEMRSSEEGEKLKENGAVQPETAVMAEGESTAALDNIVYPQRSPDPAKTTFDQANDPECPATEPHASEMKPENIPTTAIAYTAHTPVQSLANDPALSTHQTQAQTPGPIQTLPTVPTTTPVAFPSVEHSSTTTGSAPQCTAPTIATTPSSLFPGAVSHPLSTPNSTLTSQSVIKPINIAPVPQRPPPPPPPPPSQGLPITTAPVTSSGAPPPSLSPLKRSYPTERSPFPGLLNGDMMHSLQQEENGEGKKMADRENSTNGFTPPNKKKRGPRQYKCDICGAEFVYAGVFSKHMWKHNRYSKTSPTPEMPPMLNPTSLHQGISRTSMVNILAQHNRPTLPLDMSSQSKLASIPQQATNIGTLHAAVVAAAKSPTQVPPNASNTSVDMKKNENGGSYMHSGETCEDMVDDSGLYADDSLAEVHMEKKDGAGYDCWICGRPFHYRPPFIRHMRGAHEIRVIFDENRASNKTGKIFTCKLCSQSFLYQLPFEKHMKLIHGTSMDSVSAKMIDIRDQRDMHRELHMMMPMTQDTSDQDKEKSVANTPLNVDTKMMLNDSTSSSPLQKMSMAAKCHSLVAKGGLVSPPSATVALTMASSMPSVVPSMCSQSNGPSSLVESSVKIPSKDNDYILIDSSGNHIMFGDKLQCFVCSEQFSDKRLYLVHMQNEHGIQPKEENSPFKAVGTKTGKVFNCHLCQRRFSYKGPYEKHMRSHGINLVVLEKEVTQESLYCEICGKVFAYQLPYEKHMRNVHNIGTPLKSTTQQLQYRQDYRNVHQCEICFRTFATMQSLVKHVINKHQTQIGCQFTNNDYSPVMKHDAGSSQENSMEMPIAENESGSETEDLPQRVYLDPHSVLKDLSSILPPEDDDDVGESHFRITRKESEEEQNADVRSPDLISTGDQNEPRVEPARVQHPGSTLSMIKCEICNKMFRYKIAFSKHIQQMHSDQNSDQLNNNNKLELPEDSIVEPEDEHIENVVKNNHMSPKQDDPPSDSCDMPVDYSNPRKKHSPEEQQNKAEESTDKPETPILCQNTIQQN